MRTIPYLLSTKEASRRVVKWLDDVVFTIYEATNTGNETAV